MFGQLHVPHARPGAHIRVISPAMPYLAGAPARARRAEQALTDLGFTVSYGRRARLVSEDGAAAGPGRARAADFTEAFEDPDVDIVLASEAGLGSRDLLDHLDPARIAAHPKPFAGYCDNVFLSCFLAASAGLSSLYGCTFLKHFGEAGGPFPETVRFFASALDGGGPLRCDPVASRVAAPRNWFIPEIDCMPRTRDVPGGWDWIRPGTARGTLVGGEISLITTLVREFGLSLCGAVLFWDVAYGGRPAALDFRDVCETADVGSLAGMIVGAHPAIAPAQWAVSVASLLEEFVPEARFPVVVNADLSHLSPSWIVPFGTDVQLDSAGSITFPRGAGVLAAARPESWSDPH